MKLAQDEPDAKRHPAYAQAKTITNDVPFCCRPPRGSKIVFSLLLMPRAGSGVEATGSGKRAPQRAPDPSRTTRAAQHTPSDRILYTSPETETALVKYKIQGNSQGCALLMQLGGGMIAEGGAPPPLLRNSQARHSQRFSL